MRNLIDKLNYYTELYDKGTPEISDKEYDDLYFQLKDLENRSGIVYPDSPTQNIHYELVSELNKIEHDHAMLSLDKTKDRNEIANFLHGEGFVVMFKLDGLTCSLTYEDGKLVKAETRGNGLVGEDILHNAKVVKNIPQTISYKEKIVVDGEIICRLDDFVPFADEYKNPRNFAAGSIRLLSSKECASRNLSFIAWEMIEGFPEVNYFHQRLFLLGNLGFDTVPYAYSNEWGTIDSVFEVLKERFKEDRNIYPMDGYVFKFDDVAYGNKQGQTDHHLKNAIAFKFYDELYDTRLKWIEWSMGRTGVLTPIAIFDPIDIDGTTVERASLHNVSVMRETLGDCAYVGEPLKIYKANQIIPQIAEAGPKHDYGYVISHAGVSANDNPEYCPICNHEIDYVKSEDGVINAYCSNPLCDGKLINILDHFAGKKGLDIKGLSKATFEKLIDWGWIKNCEDIFALSNFKNEWIKKPGFGMASVNKILKAISDAKNTTLDKFISAIGIPLIGRTAAKGLADNFKTYEDFRNAVMNNKYHFFTINNFGEEMDHNIKNFNYTEADKISKILIFEAPVVNNVVTNNNLAGKTIVVTGKLTKYKNRDELKAVIKEHGGKTSDSISSKTDYLICNDKNSMTSKTKKAKELNIQIITEEECLQLITQEH